MKDLKQLMNLNKLFLGLTLLGSLVFSTPSALEGGTAISDEQKKAAINNRKVYAYAQSSRERITLTSDIYVFMNNEAEVNVSTSEVRLSNDKDKVGVVKKSIEYSSGVFKIYKPGLYLINYFYAADDDKIPFYLEVKSGGGDYGVVPIPANQNVKECYPGSVLIVVGTAFDDFGEPLPTEVALRALHDVSYKDVSYYNALNVQLSILRV